MAMTPDKYAHVKLDGIDLKPGEPWFLIRGQDKYAIAAVRAYADLLEEAGRFDDAAHIYQHAEAIKEWQEFNPQYVKEPD